ncbi:CIC_collapsed_G0004050.mRNA.1.CDS.1 [Saccharomyces cerevisiae]|nr:CIC_collapsed_G0004050.mRNA.1.CDS.1 [Saccharomyces cerevisiae]
MTCYTLQKCCRQDKTRLVGPNCPGIMDPATKVRILVSSPQNFQAGKILVLFQIGNFDIRSCSANYNKLTLVKVMVYRMGGMLFPGTDFVDALKSISRR